MEKDRGEEGEITEKWGKGGGDGAGLRGGEVQSREVGQAGGSSYYPPCQLWMEPAGDYGTFCKATMEAVPIRTHFHPLCFLRCRTNTALSSLPRLATYQAQNQADTWSPGAALSKLNTPPLEARNRRLPTMLR
ncbi:unnamed protein product [Pleuronectes platessa]|uniref:Uncharacterized protein n=1 Tax=Pleuronectes platessa TaxID=8262 RepID=A0A9N7U5V0_PLEPL|nr:unnamed protein product [Pleuronectes platessa]